MKSPLIGNERLWSIINSMILNKKIPHAILLEGDKGLGKKTLAKFLAKACLCDQNEPCLECKTCHLIDVGSHTDCQIIEPEENMVKVDQIRQLRVEAFMSPLYADGRVFIIDQAHTMNANAQNALLKVLEEPPMGVTFILLSKSASLLLETIRSRTVCFTLSPVPLENEGAERIAEVLGVPFENAFNLLVANDGNIGASIDSVNSEDVLLSGVAKEIFTFAANNDKLKVLQLLQPFSKDRKSVSELIYELKNVVSNEIKKKAVKEYSSFTASKLNYCYDELTSMQSKLEYNPSVSLLLSCIAAILTD